MKCETAQEQIVLMIYGELEDGLQIGLERHISGCEACRADLATLQSMDLDLQHLPVVEPSPNFVAQSRMRLDEALDTIPPHGFLTRLQSNFYRWAGTIQSAPALATLLVGVGFLTGDFSLRYKLAHAPKPQPPVVLSNATQGTVANVSGIEQTPGSELVQVHYNRTVPETIEGSLDDPQIRNLLMMGTRAGASEAVRADSVGMMAGECELGHRCESSTDGQGLRNALMVSLRYDSNPGVRMKALKGLQRYVGQDLRVRDAVLEALMSDTNAGVRKEAIGLLEPVQTDSSVRQVLRTVSAQDTNPFIRTASFEMMQSGEGIQ